MTGAWALAAELPDQGAGGRPRAGGTGNDVVTGLALIAARLDADGAPWVSNP